MPRPSAGRIGPSKKRPGSEVVGLRSGQPAKSSACEVVEVRRRPGRRSGATGISAEWSMRWSPASSIVGVEPRLRVSTAAHRASDEVWIGARPAPIRTRTWPCEWGHGRESCLLCAKTHIHDGEPRTKIPRSRFRRIVRSGRAARSRTGEAEPMTQPIMQCMTRPIMPPANMLPANMLPAKEPMRTKDRSLGGPGLRPDHLRQNAPGAPRADLGSPRPADPSQKPGFARHGRAPSHGIGADRLLRAKLRGGAEDRRPSARELILVGALSISSDRFAAELAVPRRRHVPGYQVVWYGPMPASGRGRASRGSGCSSDRGKA